MGKHLENGPSPPTLIGRTFDISSSDLHSTDLRYDTWVMQTIWGRIANNTTTKPLVG